MQRLSPGFKDHSASQDQAINNKARRIDYMSGTVSLTTTEQQIRMTGRWVDCTIKRCPESEIQELASEIGHMIDVLNTLVERPR